MWNADKWILGNTSDCEGPMLVLLPRRHGLINLHLFISRTVLFEIKSSVFFFIWSVILLLKSPIVRTFPEIILHLINDT